MSFFQNTCKPKGFAGKVMVNMMNAGHAALAEWGLTHMDIQDVYKRQAISFLQHSAACSAERFRSA